MATASDTSQLQIQKWVAHGYDFHCARIFILTVADASLARQFLLKLAHEGWITSAAQGRGDVAEKLAQGKPPLSVGVTYKGLEALGLRDRYCTVLMHRAKAFYQGAYLRSAETLGDVGVNAARFWESAYNMNSAHVVISLHADSAVALDAAQETLQTMAGQAFAQGGDWQEVAQHGAHLDHTDAARAARRVHFDMRDGISNPQFPALQAGKATNQSEKPAPGEHALGELVLGYDNDYGGNAWQLPFERPAEVSGRLLGQPPEQSELTKFFKNASFGVIRKLSQDEQAFRRFVADWVARNANAGEEAAKAAWLRAKLVGRWEDGSVVQPPHAQKKDDESLNAFDFSDDKGGEGCPFGSHIRRMNPRADMVVPSRHRPLLRRSIPYGAKFSAGESDRVERGLLGVFFCADIEDQFEHLLREWADMNPMGTPSKSRSKDPLIGQHVDPNAAFDVPMPGEGKTRITGFQPFVKTLGTVYALFPGLQAFQMLNDSRIFASPKPL